MTVGSWWRLGVAGVTAILAAALVGLHAPTASAAGGEYTVVQCDPLNRGHQASVSDSRAYEVHNFCAEASQDYALKLLNVKDAETGRLGLARWSAPAPLGIVGASLQYKARNDAGHHARIFAADAAGRETKRIVSGQTDAAPFRSIVLRFPPASQLVAWLRCDRSGGCPRSDQAKTWMRNVRMTVADYRDPSFSGLDGSLWASGWRRGSHGLTAVALDEGAGLERIVATANGAQLAVTSGQCPGRIPGTALSSRLIPCVQNGELRLNADTTRPPFRNGANGTSVCAIDFAGNRRCDQRTVWVDNAPPQLAFANEQDQSDPELIRAPVSDPHSGVASGRILFRAVGGDEWQPLSTRHEDGELRARVDSASYPPGRYEFKAEASDVAGNAAESVSRANGEPMVLSFPLREPVRLSTHMPGGSPRQTVPYGTDSRVAGRLVDASGEPLRSHEVRIEEYFGPGALIDRRVREVRTDARGRFASKLPAGPSRTVTAIYEGTPRYLDRRSSAGRLAVRSRASFRVSRRKVRAGKAVVFRGKVGRLGARIPAGGKLVELQVREGPSSWNTVREAFRTNDRGRYRLRYRFGTFYERDARFRFRVKVAREQRWPYKAPSGSKSRRVVVKAR